MTALTDVETNNPAASEMTSLLEIGEALSGAAHWKAALHRVLEILARRHGIIRGAIALVAEGSSEPAIEASLGDSIEDHQARYGASEGCLFRVVESGKPVVRPKVTGESVPSGRSGVRKINQGCDVTFICVPVLLSRKAAGSIGVDFRFEKDRDFDHLVQYLSVVASLVAQAVKANRHVAVEKKRLMEANLHLREESLERYDFSSLIGNSGPLREVYEQVTKVARSNTTVMIRGESGTGKELIAHAIHHNSLRKEKPFIKVSCGALPDTLIESELFGYEKGAFTGADAQKKGRFELAEGGTLFLDEIGELNASTAVKLLRVLQEREFERLGGTRTIKTNVRLIVATHKDLEKAIVAGTFREDLYYRLNVFSIFLPPLRERKPDVLLLADHFLRIYSNEHGKQIKRISTAAIDMLMSYHWPGNVRELRNTIERAVLVCDGNVVHGHHLPPTLQTAEASGTMLNVSFKDAVEAYERDLIQDVLKTSRGNCARAAKLLRTTERVVNYKVRKYNIDCTRFKT